MAAGGFSLDKSQIGEDKLAEFVAGDIEEDITSVPGIGPSAQSKLAADGVDTTFQLIGKFLSFRGKGVTVRQHADAFWQYLAGLGITSHRSGIVRSIAERVDVLIPGIFDKDQL